MASFNRLYLQKMETSHVVHHLPAYDGDGNIIRPSMYEETLAGAIVRVCFTVVRYHFERKHL